MNKPLTLAGACALFFPVLYFVLQLIAAPFYPGYSFISNAASDLGSPDSLQPLVFNIGALIIGVIGLIGAFGLWHGLRARGSGVRSAGVLAFAVALAAASSIWAGMFPLPDPMHGQNPLTVGLFVMPFVALFTLWQRAGRALRLYLLLNILCFAALAYVLSGTAGIPIGPIQGLTQRAFALVAFGPIGVAAWLLRG